MICSVEDCEDAAKYAGMCGKHYKRWWRHGDTSVNKCPPVPDKPCIVEGCNRRMAYNSGYCTMHDQRIRMYGREHRITREYGTGTINAHGYVVIGGQYEHIMLAEKALGKKLPKGAVVHHTVARGDNHGPFKLVICPDQAYHALLHKRMRDLGYENN